jgi:hypothetical protein
MARENRGWGYDLPFAKNMSDLEALLQQSISELGQSG